MKLPPMLNSIQFPNDPRFKNAVYESLILYKKLKKIKQNYMKTQNEYPIELLTKLVSMTDFIKYFQSKPREQLCKLYPLFFEFDRNLRVDDYVRIEQKQWHLICTYSSFLKQSIKLEMFIPVNGNEKVLFKGFILKKQTHKGKVETYLYKENATLPFAQIHEKERLRFIAIPVYGDLIENISGFGLELTENALKQIFGHASY